MDPETRKLRVNKIYNSIMKLFARGENIEFERLVAEVCRACGTSRRTTLEYIDTALVSINHKIERINGIKYIVQKGKLVQDMKLDLFTEGETQ